MPKRLVVSRITDDFIHPVVILPDGKGVIIYCKSISQPTNVEAGSIVGHIAIAGKGRKRRIENEDSTEFWKEFNKVLKKPFHKMKIV